MISERQISDNRPDTWFSRITSPYLGTVLYPEVFPQIEIIPNPEPKLSRNYLSGILDLAQAYRTDTTSAYFLNKRREGNGVSLTEPIAPLDLASAYRLGITGEYFDRLKAQRLNEQRYSRIEPQVAVSSKPAVIIETPMAADASVTIEPEIKPTSETTAAVLTAPEQPIPSTYIMLSAIIGETKGTRRWSSFSLWKKVTQSRAVKTAARVVAGALAVAAGYLGYNVGKDTLNQANSRPAVIQPAGNEQQQNQVQVINPTETLTTIPTIETPTPTTNTLPTITIGISENKPANVPTAEATTIAAPILTTPEAIVTPVGIGASFAGLDDKARKIGEDIVSGKKVSQEDILYFNQSVNLRNTKEEDKPVVTNIEKSPAQRLEEVRNLQKLASTNGEIKVPKIESVEKVGGTFVASVNPDLGVSVFTVSIPESTEATMPVLNAGKVVEARRVNSLNNLVIIRSGNVDYHYYFPRTAPILLKQGQDAELGQVIANLANNPSDTVINKFASDNGNFPKNTMSFIGVTTAGTENPQTLSNANILSSSIPSVMGK